MRNFRKVMTYLVIVIIALIAAVNYEIFVFPNKFAPSGLNGLCTMVQHLAGISVGFLSLIINIPLAIWVYFEISKPLAVRSMVYVVTFSVAILILDRVDLSAFYYVTETGTSAILGPLVAGIIWGGCYSLLVQCSAYSGGTDFIAAIIHKRKPEQNMFYLIFSLNVVVALISYFVYDYRIEPVILCILYAFTTSTVCDKLNKNGRSAVCFEIITDYPEEISREIIDKLHHSTTLIPAKGMYSGRETNMLVCVVNKTQVAAISAIVRRYPNTFAIMDPVSEVMGNFKRMDSGGKEERHLLDSADGKAV
jgi:uncharacterized membrane-anchored protein YitT (DUF2179 family)